METVQPEVMRTLEGQGPKLQSILTKPFSITHADLTKVLDENCSVDSDAWYTVGVEKWAGKDYLDQFFLRPADPEAYDPAKHPKK